MANAAGSKGTRGDVAPSRQGRAGLRLQNALPDARVLYVSATGAFKVIHSHIEAALEATGIAEGRLFRSVRKNGLLGTQLDASQIPRIYKAMARPKRAGERIGAV